MRGVLAPAVLAFCAAHNKQVTEISTTLLFALAVLRAKAQSAERLAYKNHHAICLVHILTHSWSSRGPELLSAEGRYMP